jgi:hypothetical protein
LLMCTFLTNSCPIHPQSFILLTTSRVGALVTASFGQ